jgi:hypothetical protein
LRCPHASQIAAARLDDTQELRLVRGEKVDEQTQKFHLTDSLLLLRKKRIKVSICPISSLDERAKLSVEGLDFGGKIRGGHEFHTPLEETHNVPCRLSVVEHGIDSQARLKDTAFSVSSLSQLRGRLPAATGRSVPVPFPGPPSHSRRRLPWRPFFGEHPLPAHHLPQRTLSNG